MAPASATSAQAALAPSASADKGTDLTAARTMVRRLAPHLGLEPDAVPLRVADAQNSGLLGSARGVAAADGILLRPSALTDPDPALFAHELAHIAQHRNSAAPTQSSASRPRSALDRQALARPSVTAAEAEAAALANAARYGTALWRPSAILPSGHLARDVGSVGVAPKRPADPVPGTATTGSASTQADSSMDPAEERGELAKSASDLRDLVLKNHTGELSRIRAELGSFWDLDDEKRDYVLAVLDPVPFTVARAMMQTLDPDQRQRMARLNDQQHQAHPAAAVAVLAALDTSDIDTLGPHLTLGRNSALHGLAPDRLDATSLRALYGVLRHLRRDGLLQLLDTNRRDFFRDLLATPPPVGSEQEDLDSALADENRRARIYSYSMGSSGGAKGADNPSSGIGPGETQGVDLALVNNLVNVLSDHNTASARQALDSLTSLAESTEDAHPGKAAGTAPGVAGTATSAETPSDLDAETALKAPIEPGERLRAVVTELDRRGLIDVILDHLPAQDRYSGAPPTRRGSILATVLAARAPGLTLPRIESLLSYGILDWAITDDDALFANLLVHSLPLSVQEEWRHHDGGKWLHRLEDNLPANLITSGYYTGVGSEFAGAGSADASDQATLKLLGWALGEWESGKDAESALTIVDRLAGAAVTDPTLPAPTPQAATGAIRRLDALGTFDTILMKLSDEYITSATGRHRIDRVASMRDPLHDERQAASLLSGNFLGIVKAHHAWLARLLLRALPPAEQIRFQEENPKLWSSMESALTPEMRRSDANQALTGRDGFPPIEDIRARLRDVKLWDAKHMMQLRALIDLAYASDDREFVFTQSKTFRADLREGLDDLVHDLGLYDEARNHTTYTPEKLEVPGLIHELGSLLFEGIRLGLFAVGPLLEILSTSFGYTMHIDIDLERLQWALGGDVFGVEFADRGKSRPAAPVPDAEKPAVHGATKPTAKPGPDAAQKEAEDSNRFKLDLDTGTGAFRLRLPVLRLDRINIAKPGASYRTGSFEVHGLEVTGDLSDTHYREPIGVEISMTDADVQDLVIADSRAPGGAIALADIALESLKFKAGETGAEDLKGHRPRKGSLDLIVPVIGPLLQAFENIVALWGGIPGDYTLVDLMLLPVTSAFSIPGGAIANFAADEALEHAADARFPSPAPADYLYGLASDGAFRPPRSVARRATDAMSMLRSMQLSFSKLAIKGASIGAGTQVSSLTLKDVSVGLGWSKPTYLRAQIKSLDRRIALLTGAEKSAAIAQRADLKVRLGALLADEARLDKLENKDRWISGSLSEEERTGHQKKPSKGTAKGEASADSPSMAALNHELREDTGVVIDVGSVEIGETSGTVEIAGARLGPTHIEARLPAQAAPILNAGYLDDKSLAEAFLSGEPKHRTVAQFAAASEVRFKVDSVQLLPNPDGGPMVRIHTADGNWEAQTVKSGAITGGVDPDRGVVYGRLNDLEVDGITMPGGYGIRRVTGSLDVIPLDLNVAAGTSGATKGSKKHKAKGKDDFKTFLKGLRPKLGADLVVEDFTMPGGKIHRIGLTGLSGTPEVLDDGIRVPDLSAKAITVEGIDLAIGDGRIAGNNTVVLSEVSLDVTRRTGGTELGRHGAIQIHGLSIREITGDDLTYTTVDKESQLTVTLKRGSLGDIKASEITLEQDAADNYIATGSASVGQVGDIRYEVVSTLFGKAAAKKGAPATKDETSTISGEIASSTPTPTPIPATASGAATTQTPAISVGFAMGGGSTKLALDLHGLEAIKTKYTSPDGSLTVARTGIDVKMRKDGGVTSGTLGLSNFDMTSLNWHTPTTTVTAPGHVRLASLTVDGKYIEDPPDAAGVVTGTGRIQIDNLTATGLDASDLRYRDLSQDPPTELQLGALHPHPGALHVEQITLSKFVLPVGPHGKLRFDQAAGRLGILGAHLDASLVSGALKASGSVDAASIAISFSQGGKRLTARATGVGADLGIHGDGWAAQAQILTGADTGLITVTPEAITVQGLKIPDMSLNGLKVDTSAPDPFHLWMSERGGVYVRGVHADAKIDRATSQIALTHMHVDQIDAEGFTVTLPDSGISVRVPAGTTHDFASIKNIDLTAAEGQDGFVISPKGAQKALGTVKVDSILVPRLQADVDGIFHGEVRLGTGAASIGFLEHGHTSIKVADLVGGILGIGKVGTSGNFLMIEKFGAGAIDAEDGKVTATGLTAGGLSYVTPAVILEAKDFSVPGPAEFTGKSAKIPKALITNGHIIVDFTMLSGASGTGSGTSSGPTITPGPELLRTKLLDEMNGTVPLHILVRHKPIPLPNYDPRDIRIDVNVNVVDGMLDLEELRVAIISSIYFDKPSGVLSTATEYLDFSLDGTRLTFELPHITDLFAWNLTDPADVKLYNATPGHPKLRVATAIKDYDAGGGGGGGSSPFTVELNLDPSTLTVHNAAPIPIAFKGGPDGHVTLSSNVLTGFGLSGNLVPIRSPGDSGAGAIKGLTLSHFGIDDIDLTFGSQELKTGKLHIDGAKDGTLSLDDLTPGRLELYIDSAEADDIDWHKP